MSQRTRRSVLKALTAMPVASVLWRGKVLGQTVPRLYKELDRIRITTLSLSPTIARLNEQVTVTVTAYNPAESAANNVPWELTFGAHQPLRGSVTIGAKSSATFSGTFSASRLPRIPVVAAIDPANTLTEPLAQRANNRIETTLVVQASTPDQWSNWARNGAQEAQGILEELTQYTNIGWSAINGPELKFSLRCQAPALDNVHILTLTQKGLPQDVARAFVESVRKAYESWVGGARGTLPGAYPAFAAMPAPVAPPTPNVPHPLAAAGSAQVSEFTPTALASAVKLRLGARAAESGAGPAVDAFSSAVSSRFSLLLATKMLQNALGTGPVPQFAPPYVPVGPVSGGSVVPALRHVF